MRARLASIAPSGSRDRSMLLDIRATVLAGVWLGALVGGVGGRLGMMLLRVTSSEHVRGVTSDDGFFIGRVTISGTYNLIGVCAAIGVIGAASYRWVEHWLLGPTWFRQLSAALGAGAVIGSMLVHTDGVDFRLLEPRLLAIAIFVLVPAVFAFFVGPLEHALARPDAWTSRGRRAWILTIVSLVFFPPILLVAAVVSAVMALWITGPRHSGLYEDLRANRAFGAFVRVGWAAVAAAGLVGLVSDAQAILA